ncbi:hypothetical protein ACWGNM_13760 [Streptomyces sp. NPDC055796]
MPAVWSAVIAYIRDANGLEFTTAVRNIVPAEYVEALEGCLDRR